MIIFFQRYIHNISIAVEAVFANKFRSVLTALGIIFGVAAVISMLAIGNGARQEILEQMKQVGVNNIVITPIVETEDSQSDDAYSGEAKRFSTGLTLADAYSIQKYIPTVVNVSPEIVFNTFLIKDGIRQRANVIGVKPAYFEIFNISLQEGQMFNETQLKNGEPVCIIGQSVKTSFFGKQNPIGQMLKCGNVWLRVIGVIEDRNISETASENFKISDFNNTVYAPVQTVLRRYRDRSMVTAANINMSQFASNDDKKNRNINQIDKVVVQVKETDQLNATSEIIRRMLYRRHNDNEDFSIVIPELLLQQEQRTKDIFNIVLGAIAGISLIVGGIGIMNIMLASVMERTKEIGIRLAIGATKRDIVLQFLSEATLISVTGGIIGIVTGVVLSKIIMNVTDILTIVSSVSILISFGVSVSVGILFGYMPAMKAAQKDPVSSLRYE